MRRRPTPPSGQGFVLVTPLQLATFLCAVANGGTVYQPRLYSRVENYKGDTVAQSRRDKFQHARRQAIGHEKRYRKECGR